MCESHTPCALHAQPPESLAGAASRYWLKREKSIRHTSPSLGGSARLSPAASHFIEAQGSANSAVQPRSRSELSLIVPSTCAPALSPGRSQRKNPSRGPRGCVVNPTPFHGL